MKTEAKGTAKSKAARGVAADLITSWLDLNLSPEDNETLNKAAKQRGVNVAALVKRIAEPALKEAWPQIQADALLYTPSQRPGLDLETATEEQLLKEQARLEKEVERLQAAAARAREVQSAKTK